MTRYDLVWCDPMAETLHSGIHAWYTKVKQYRSLPAKDNPAFRKAQDALLDALGYIEEGGARLREIEP